MLVHCIGSRGLGPRVDDLGGKRIDEHTLVQVFLLLEEKARWCRRMCFGFRRKRFDSAHGEGLGSRVSGSRSWD